MTEDSSTPQFGPGGYLPERASKRARKIVLRAPLGLQWIVASAVFGILVLVTGLVWLNAGGPPGPPFVAAGALPTAEGPTVTHLPDVDAWLVTGTGPALAVPTGQVDELAWCDVAGQFESADGRVWSATGRGYDTPSLRTHPVVVHDGAVYVDPTTVREGTRPSGDPRAPAC